GPVILSPLFQSVGLIPRAHVIPREIPLLEEKETSFARIIERGKEIVLDAGVHVNGYPRFDLEGDAGTEITITYLERFGDGTDGQCIDDLNGSVSGRADHLILNGKPLCYEPFWVRTFRYIVISGGRLTQPPIYRKTGYPLPIQSSISSSAPWVGQLWDMCVRTLQNCMLETYMDCPYYEQLQFIMDARLQMLFTYAVSNDTRLAKKALLDFHCGMRPEGLLPGKTPTAYCQVISTFSLHDVFALWEYVEHTGDTTLGRLYRPDVDRILDYYDGKRDDTGLVRQIAPWAFIDWQDDWKETGGVSPAYFEGPSAIINLMYAYALECGAKLYEATGRPGTAEEYRQRRKDILRKVKALCFDQETGMVREGPSCRQFTRHAQAWAVINGMFTEAESRRALQTALSCPPCSFAASYEWFRALEKAGMEGQMRRDLDAWIGLLSRGSTTCPEEPHHPRSECHAWSALPLYEFMRTLAGVRQENGRIIIRPRLLDLPDLSGVAITSVGSVQYHYHKDQSNGLRYEITIPEKAEGCLILPEGRQILFTGKLFYT
ncbi:MAG: family 78 glycoside hydrolase catalytic domain, partial [Clostridia bacterium]|nr:family 78 glycoside hydrolase catalytic domain [Clostridia bacterium]